MHEIHCNPLFDAVNAPYDSKTIGYDIQVMHSVAGGMK